MRRGGMIAREEGIQPLLGLGKPGRNGVTQAPQPRGADRDQERGDGLEASSEVVEASRDQVAAREVRRFHGRMVPAKSAGGQTAAVRPGVVVNTYRRSGKPGYGSFALDQR